jgi:hypothetical protein
MTNREKFSFQDVFINNSKSCKEVENLQRYFLKLLTDGERQKFEAHLTGCETCLESLAQLSESDLAVETTVVDAKQAEIIFQKNRERIQEMFSHKYRNAPAAFAGKNYRLLMLINVMLFVAVAVLIYPAYTNRRLNQKIAQMETQLEMARTAERTNPPAVTPVSPEPLNPALSQSKLYAVDIHRGAEEENRIVISFKNTNRRFTLLFSVPPEDFTRYEVEIAKGEKQVWRGSLAATGGNQPQLISVMLDEQYFATGPYFLEITGVSGSRQVKFPKYILEVSN